jgi:hypothetical protein
MPAPSPDTLAGHARAGRHDYADWKAPAKDSQMLIWPEPRQLLDDTRANHRLLTGASHVRIQNAPLLELRRQLRAAVGHQDDAQPIVATGHQTELFHAGVWVKNALIDVVARNLGGQAYHVAVDTDAPKHLILRWPGRSVPITDDAALTSAAWSGLVDAPSPAHLDQITAALAEDRATFGYEPMLPQVLLSLRRLAIDAPKLPATLTNATHELDWSLGLRHHAMLLSPVLLGEPYLAFVHHVMARAVEFAMAYNGALADYRRATGTTSPSRPMPDLFVGENAVDSVEAPFWLDDLASGRRTRPNVFASGRGFVLELVSGDAFEFDPTADANEAATKLAQWLRRSQHRLSPRALTLTMFLRLLLADQFVHGIGGGRYDQVTDRIIARHFGLEPPRFAVTTATMYWPAAVGRQRVCLPCVVQEGHRLRHALLGDVKREYISRITSLPRRSRDRSAVFTEMHQALKRAATKDERLRAWQQRLQETQSRDAEDATIFDRELFYALQPRERLAGIIARYDAEIRNS